MLEVTVVAQGVKVGEDVRSQAIEAVRGGSSNRQAASDLSISSPVVDRWIRALGGVFRDQVGRSGRHLSFEEREEISRGLAQGLSLTMIGEQLGRAPSTITREVNRNGGRDWYRAGIADHRATQKAARPKTPKMVTNTALGEGVEALLEHKWSPKQISQFLKEWFVEDLEMRVSHETIYQALYVQGRGGLRSELSASLRTGRAYRYPRGTRAGTKPRTRFDDMVMISDRPAEIEDRAVPGHWEGDLIIGANSRSAIGTLVERTTRYVMLLWLPDRHDAASVSAAMAAKIAQLPKQLFKSVTWDQGSELANHKQFTIDTGVAVYFCEPSSPWQRGTNENTNGLLRQYFPKGTDLSVHSEQHLDHVAAELNARPRKTLNWMPPSRALNELIVASTA